MESVQQFSRYCARDHDLIGFNSILCPVCEDKRQISELKTAGKILANRCVKLELGISQALVRAKELGV